MAAERSSQSLWKIITGHSAIRIHELILAEVKTCKTKLTEGLGYFKPPSPASEAKLKSSKNVKGRKLDFVLQISKHLSLDQLQCLELFQNFLLEGYRGSFDDINTRLSNEVDRKTLLLQLEDYYNKERLYLLRCIKQFLGYWQDGSHPYREVYENCLSILDFDGPKFIPGVWGQFEKCSSLEIPPTVETPEEEIKWLKQNLLQQVELLEILLLFYKDYELSINILNQKFKIFQRVGFGYNPRGRYTPGISNDPLCQHHSNLCGLILLESLDLEWLLQNQDNPTELQKHHLLDNSISQHVKEFETNLQETTHTPNHTPLLLSWYILKYMTCGDDDNIDFARCLGNQALHGKVFEVLLILLRSPFFSGDRPVAGVCRGIVYTLLSLAVSSFSENSLCDPRLLFDIASCVLNHPRLRLAFWEKGIDQDLGLLLKAALRRFPAEIDGVVDMLLPLSHDENSAHNVYKFISHVVWYTDYITPHSLAGVLDMGPQEGTWVLTRSRTLFEYEYQSLGLSPLILPRGTVGVVIEEEETENNERQLVCWNVKYSGWDLFGVLLNRLMTTPGIGVDSETHPLTEFIIKVVNLVTEVIKYDWSVVSALQPITTQLFTLLQKFSPLPHPPSLLIASSVECLSVLVKKEHSTIWKELTRTGFLPQLLGSVESIESLHVSPGHYGHLLNVWERAHGIYPITTAMLHLLLNTLKSLDNHVTPEGVVATVVYIMQAVFVSSHNWRYQSQLDRDKFCHQLLSLCYSILQRGRSDSDNTLQNLLHQFVVNLLLHSSGHLLLVNVLGTGVNTIDKLIASAISWTHTAVSVESLKISFEITDLLLQNKPSESITPLEQALATRTIHHPTLSFSSSLTSTQHLITELAMYIYHHDDPAVPVGATKLLARLAAVAPMSMFSCLGQEAVALRDCFVTRLSAKSEDTELKVAILELISCCMGTQPGLLELLLSLKISPSLENPNDKSQVLGTNGGDKRTCKIDVNSCLIPVMDMIDPDQQTPPVPLLLLSSGMALLRTLWHGRHTGALEGLQSDNPKFWEYLCRPLMDKIDMAVAEKEKRRDLGHKLRTCSHVMYIIAMELYYVIQSRIDKGLQTFIQKFMKEEGYITWCEILQAVDYEDEVGVVSPHILKAQEELAESWKALLLVATSHHETLFELYSERKKVILCELMKTLESQISQLPHSINIISQVLNLYISLLKRWHSLKLNCNLIGQFNELLVGLLRCDNNPKAWELTSLLYSTILLVVSSLRKSEGDLEPRFVCGLLPLVATTIDNHTHYSQLKMKHPPEMYAIHLVSEISSTLPDDEPIWLTTLREHSIIMMFVRISTGYLDSLSRPEIIEASLMTFLSLSKSKNAAELLQVNNISELLSISLSSVVNRLDTVSQDRMTHISGYGVTSLLKVSRPSPEWMRVWFTALKLVTRLLSTLGHHFINSALDFVGAHSERILQSLDIYIATRYLQATTETQYVCQFLQQLVFYRHNWMFGLLQQHSETVNRVLHLLNGAVAVLSRGRIKDVIKTMDTQGLLSTEQSSAAVKMKGRQRRTSGGQVMTSLDDDSWVKHSPAYIQLQDSLVSIVTSCLTILNFYSPPLSDVFMCSFTQPVDLSEWPPLFTITSIVPVIDPTAPPSITTLTSTLAFGCELLKKLEPHRSCVGGTPSRSPSKSSPIRSPVTPGHPKPTSPAAQQKRAELLYMLEQTVALLLSQSLRYLLDEDVDPLEKQALKKQLVSELGNFCQSLLLNFSRKGAPSPHSALRTMTPISGSHTTLQDSLSGRASSHSFSDTPEQGLFKLADMFAKNLTR